MGAERTTHRPAALWVLVAIIALLAIGGFQGGVSFIADPTGASLGAKLSWLERTPVSDFMLPGLFLAGVLGIGGLALIVGLVAHRRWAWDGTIALGAVLLVWIGYELLVLPMTSGLQFAMALVGLALVLLPFLPSLRRWYGAEGGDRR